MNYFFKSLHQVRYLNLLFGPLLLSIILLIPALAQENTPNVSLSPENGFYVESADGFMGFRVSTRIQQQLGITTPEHGYDGWTPEAKIRRARARIHGYFFEKELTYFLQMQMDKGVFALTNAEFRWKATDNLKFIFGQHWPAAGRQFRTVSEVFQMIDRSPVTQFFSPGYDIGITAQYDFEYAEDGWIKSYLSVTHGEGMNTPTAPGGFAYTGRIELLPLGDFENGGDYIESDIYREETSKISLGASLYRNADAFTQYSGNGWSIPREAKDDITALYLDLLYKYNGFSLLAEYAGRSVEIEDQFNNYPYYLVSIKDQVVGGRGLSTQFGKFISQKNEVTFRASLLYPHEVQIQGKDFTTQNAYTFGFNHFIRGHHIKLQFEMSLVDESYDYRENHIHYQFLSQFSISF